MLRQWQTNLLNSEFFYGQYTLAGGTAVSNIGTANFTSISRTGAGIFRGVVGNVQPSDSLGGFNRTIAGYASPALTSTAGSFAFADSANSTNSIDRVTCIDAAGTGVDNGVNYLSAAYMSSANAAVCPQGLRARRNKTRIIWGKVTAATPSIAINKQDFSVTSASTGVFTIVFKRAFASGAVALVQPISTSSDARAVVTSTTAGGCVVTVSNAAGTLSSAIDFYILAVGQDSTSGGITLSEVWSTQRKPRFVHHRITYAAGAPVVSAYAFNTGTLTQNGTGDFTVNYVKPFKREPLVLVNASNSLSTIVHTSSVGSVRILTDNAAGAATTISNSIIADVLVFGSDDATEY